MLTAPQIIKSPSGDELVVLSRADYDAMVAALAEALGVPPGQLGLPEPGGARAPG